MFDVLSRLIKYKNLVIALQKPNVYFFQKSFVRRNKMSIFVKFTFQFSSDISI